MDFGKELGIEGASPLLSSNVEDYGNDPILEKIWAMKAMKYAETHMKLLEARDAKELKLTKYDDNMYKEFQEQFKDLKIDIITPVDIKSDEAKVKWRKFCSQYDKLIIDYNFATLMRIDSSKDYSDENTIIVPRTQFLAIEVVRNRLGFNSVHYNN